MNFDIRNVLIRIEVITLFLLKFRQEINMQSVALISPALLKSRESGMIQQITDRGTFHEICS
jgi:hypothetical protein